LLLESGLPLGVHDVHLVTGFLERHPGRPLTTRLQKSMPMSGTTIPMKFVDCIRNDLAIKFGW
jgi:hypothetical protein